MKSVVNLLLLTFLFILFTVPRVSSFLLVSGQEPLCTVAGALPSSLDEQPGRHGADDLLRQHASGHGDDRCQTDSPYDDGRRPPFAGAWAPRARRRARGGRPAQGAGRSEVVPAEDAGAAAGLPLGEVPGIAKQHLLRDLLAPGQRFRDRGRIIVAVRVLPGFGGSLADTFNGIAIDLCYPVVRFPHHQR